MMTWKEFKDVVDNKLRELARGEDVEVCYIDISYPDIAEDVTVHVDSHNGMAVS